MSSESVLSLGVSTPSAAAPSASPAAGYGGGSAPGGPERRGSADSPGAATGASNAPATRGAPGANPSEDGTAQHSGRSHSAAAPAQASRGHPKKGAAPAAKNFSQALAQSLAAPAQAPAAALHAGPSAGPPAKAAGHSTDKAHKPDPVSTAMALMRQTVPSGAPAGTAPAKTPTSAGSQTHGTTRISAAGLAAERAAHKLMQTKTLTQTSGTEAHAAQGVSAQTGNSAANVSNAQALNAAQLTGGPPGVRSAPSPSAALSAPVGSNSWNEQLGTQITWMARQGIQTASLQMAPQHLGPVQVSISVHHGQASVWFGAAQAETRQALSQALPQLHALFAGQGLTLTDSGVSKEAPRDSRRSVRPAVNAVGEVGAAESSAATVSVGPSGTGLIDTYA